MAELSERARPDVRHETVQLKENHLAYRVERDGVSLSCRVRWFLVVDGRTVSGCALV